MEEITESNSAGVVWGNRSPAGNVFPDLKFTSSHEEHGQNTGRAFLNWKRSAIGEIEPSAMKKRADTSSA